MNLSTTTEKRRRWVSSGQNIKEPSGVITDPSKTNSQVDIGHLVKNEIGSSALQYILQHLSLDESETFVASTTTRFNIDKIPGKKYKNIVNLHRINDIRRINKFFESVNAKIPAGGLYINQVETYVTRKKRKLARFIRPFNYIYYAVDVFITRVIPKIPFTKRVYFWITKGRGRVLSRAETFGRLYSCGFEIAEMRYIDNHLYFIARKTRDPYFPKNPTYGPIIRLKRYGKHGKKFNVYKLRTMHPFSEYLQQYVYEQNNLKNGGKFKDDFRITTEGKFFRKFWLDELPMIINLLKGDMKLVGVRPLSSHYFNLYSEDLKAKRIKYKPGLVPPYYADMPESLEEIMASEMKYLEAYEKHPLVTDIRYFFKAFYNILIKKARSS